MTNKKVGQNVFVGTLWGSLFVEGGKKRLAWVLSMRRILLIGFSAVQSSAIAD